MGRKAMLGLTSTVNLMAKTTDFKLCVNCGRANFTRICFKVAGAQVLESGGSAGAQISKVRASLLNVHIEQHTRIFGGHSNWDRQTTE
jgi:hypothetical protein